MTASGSSMARWYSSASKCVPPNFLMEGAFSPASPYATSSSVFLMLSCLNILPSSTPSVILKSVSRKISSHSRRSPQNDRMPAGEPVRVQLRPSGATRPRPVTECLVAMDITVLMARLCSGFRGSSHHVIDDVFVQRPRIEQSSHHVFDVFAQASDVSFSSDGTAGSHPVGLLASQRTAFRPNRLDVLVEEQDRAEGLVLRPDRRQGAVADRPRVLEDRLVRHRPLFK
mmetsp:Transcript_21984/g.51901  ORF Transcript_21984/g.51901 Transcript_21984/m.51901 type:complete len:228 (+) Transcript_21984:1088-1771(+)